MKVSVGLMEAVPSVEVELFGAFVDPAGIAFGPGRRVVDTETTLTPVDPATASFALDAMTIGTRKAGGRERPSGAEGVDDAPEPGENVGADLGALR